MNVKEIREYYSMRDILDRCGISVNRAGFCQCVFHSGDKTPSMKVYEKSFYCFACQVGGDTITFVQKYHNLSFQDACKWISGEELTQQTKVELELARIRRQEKEEKNRKLREELNQVNTELTGLWDKIKSLEPLSDEWAKTYNRWQILCYKQECIGQELGIFKPEYKTDVK